MRWAPLSELYGRQYIFLGTYLGLTAFSAGAAAAPNIWSLLILRFLAGAIGSSPLTNAGGVLADLFTAEERGRVIPFYAIAPLLGPVIGPLVSGYVGESIGWRWMHGIMAIFTGILWVLGAVFVPETYEPTILRRRAKELSQLTGMAHESATHVQTRQEAESISTVFRVAVFRPFVLLWHEPITSLLTIYVSIVNGTLYLCFGAFPIVYQDHRGWSPGSGGLAFLGLAAGILSAIAYSVWDDRRYLRVTRGDPDFASPEARLPICMVGSVFIPAGLFCFAWTTFPEIHWIVSILASSLFGFGMVSIFLGITNYLIDCYSLYAASALAANAVLRSLFAAAFPLFTPQMYQAIGVQWASSIPAFLALACVPFPFLFHRFGRAIRARCKYSAESEAYVRGTRSAAAGSGEMEGAQQP